MKETTPAAMPPCFEKWCSCFDDLLRTKSQRREFRNYLRGLLGESERKTRISNIINCSNYSQRIQTIYSVI
jgi:hypothetical protein